MKTSPSKRATATQSAVAKKSTASKTSTAAKKSAASGTNQSTATNDDAAPQTATAAQQLDAVALLKQDHRNVEQMFAQYASLDDAQQKQELVRRICSELIVHAQLEEELFYPACREQGVETDMLDEAQVEHDSAKILITELMSGSPDEAYYDAKVSVLREQIKHHVGEEEQSRTGIMAKASAAGVDMNELGRRIQARKQELTSEGGRMRAPQPVSLTTLLEGPFTQEEQTMASQYGRERDERGRFASDDDDDRGGRSRGGNQGRERDENGRFMSDDDRGSSRSSRSRDDDDRGSGSSRSRDDDDRGSRSSRSRDDDEGRGQGRGWFGDSRGHAEAAREGWRSRDDDDTRRSRSRDDDDDGGGRSRGGSQERERDEQGRFMSDDDRSGRRSSRSRDDDDDRGSRSSRSRDDDDGRGRGWFGDSRGHAEAAREGWRSRDDDRGGSRGGRDDDRGGSRGGRSQSSRGRDDDDDGRGQGRGWFGDSRGHAEAAREGWRNRDDDRGGSSRGGRSDERSSRSSRDDDDDDGRGHGRGGWFGDSRGHAEAARQGWRNRSD